MGCGAKEQTVSQTSDPERVEPSRVNVQHILIGFKGSVSGKDIKRSQEEAAKLAEEIFARAKAGEDFDTLVEEYTDDTYPGIYGMVKNEADAEPERQIYARSTMVPAFGDVAFSLDVGEIGMTVYDKSKSKYGWHIIKRLS
jgi:parvulin-like peptidyl-prolyl isomerase